MANIMDFWNIKKKFEIFFDCPTASQDSMVALCGYFLLASGLLKLSMAINQPQTLIFRQMPPTSFWKNAREYFPVFCCEKFQGAFLRLFFVAASCSEVSCGCFLLLQFAASFPAAVFCCCRLQRGFLRLFFVATSCNEVSCGCFLLLQVAASFPAAVFCSCKLQGGFLRLFFGVASCSEVSCDCFLLLQVAARFPATVFCCCRLQRGFTYGWS